MVINKIITEKELNYIETLYLYTNLETFISEKSTALDWVIGMDKEGGGIMMPSDVEEMYDAEKYTHMLTYVHDTMLQDAEYIGDANGRTWYKFDNYRLGIMDFYAAKKSNQFNVEIQYYQHHMFTLDPKLKNLELPFDGTFDQYHIKRIDVSQIVKTPQDYLTNYGFISPFRKIHKEGTSQKTETIYLGNRKNGNVFRMYNKTIELKVDTKEKPIDYKKIALFTNYFGDIENLYTFELELHRRYLKPSFGIDKLSDLEKVYKVYSQTVGKIEIYKDNDKNKDHIRLKNYDRIDTMQFTEYKEFKRLKSKTYKPSKDFLVKTNVDRFERFEKSLSEPLSYVQRLIIIDEIVSGILKKDVSIEITSSQEEINYDKFVEKVENVRQNQDNSLEKEAYRAFKKVVANPNPFL